MVTRIERLTPEQEAQMPAWAEKWIEVGRCTDEADWATFADGARRCYGYADLPWHANVVRVSNPLVLSIAAPLAAHILDTGMIETSANVAPSTAVNEKTATSVEQAVYAAVIGALPHGHDDPAVQRAVTLAVEDVMNGPGRPAASEAVRKGWYRRLGGQWWVSWQAYLSFFKEVCDLELPGDLWDRADAYSDAQSSAGWWWPHRRFTLVCDRPERVNLERVGPAGWGSHRLHCEDGPAIAWRDGWSLHFWHGTRVPADLIEGEGWDVERIMNETNAETRRCAIERLGWDKFTARGLTEVARCADPGNPGCDIILYDLPEKLKGMYEQPARIFIGTNGTIERDGTRKKYGLVVPAHHTDPVEAAADMYGWPVQAYRDLEVRR